MSMDTTVTTALELLRRGTPRDRPSAAARVYEDMRQRILSLDFPPGTNLLRTELAAHYEVSQTPLRDAMQRLEQEDLVRIYPQSRTVVTRIDIPQIYEAHFLRTGLEAEVIRQLALRGAQETVERARSVLRLQEAAGQDDTQVALFYELDEYFHRILFEGLERDNLHRLVRSRSGHLDRVRRLQPPDRDKVRRILDGHAAILDGIEARDVEAAVSAIRDHLSKTVSRVEELRSLHEQYFA